MSHAPAIAEAVPEYIAAFVRQTDALREQMRSPRLVPDPYCSRCPDCRGAGTRPSGDVGEGGGVITTTCALCGGVGSKEGSTL